MAQTPKPKPDTRTLTPRVTLPVGEARELKAQLAREELTYAGLVLNLTRQWLAARTQKETPSTGEGDR